MLNDEAAKVLGVSGDRVRQMANTGQLPVIRVGHRGVRLYRREDVERVAVERAAATAEKAAAAACP